MPKGKHKGGRRQFTNFEALEEQKVKEEKERQWRKTQGETDSEEEEEAAEKSSASSEESSSEEEGDEESKASKPKGVSGLIETENPNRVVQKPKKVTQIAPEAATGSGKAQLSRREREEIEKQRATAHYRKLHSEGKTEEARADLARLAIIRQQREEAAKKKDEERKAKEAAASAKKEKMAKALNKKS